MCINVFQIANFESMRLIIISFFGVFLTTSCVSPSIEKLADEFCNCREIQKSQSNLQAEQCIEEWTKKYGKLRFDEEEEKKFNQLISNCQPTE